MYCADPEGVRIREIWWTRWDSNPRSPRCERGALPTKLRARVNLIHFSVSAPICQDLFKTFFTPPVTPSPPRFQYAAEPASLLSVFYPPISADSVHSPPHTLFTLFNFIADVAAVRFRTPEVKNRISILQSPLRASVSHILFTLFNFITEGSTSEH